MKIQHVITFIFTAALMSAAAHASEVRKGTFEGASRHQTSGHVSLSGDANQATLTLESDFLFDGAPDPKLALGNNGFDPKTMFTMLKSNSGAQVYRLPPGIDPTKYNEVWVWCETYDVPLGKAELR